MRIDYLIVLLFVFFLSSLRLTAQDNTFYRKYNLSGMQGGLQIATTSDGGFVATGQHEGNGSAGSCDIYVYRVDVCGNLIWFKLFGGSATDGGKSINQTADGGFIVSGHYNGGIGFNLRLDADGNATWLKTYSNTSWIMYSEEAANGDIICLGHDGLKLIRCNSMGDVIWSKELTGLGNMGLYLHEVPNGDIIVSSVGAGIGKDFCLVRLNAMGDIIWSRGYGGGWTDSDHTNWSNRGTVDEANNVITLTCPTYAGSQGGENILVTQVDLTSGSVVWSKSYGGAGSDQSRDITPHPGGFAIVGNSNSYNVAADPVNNITEALSERDILLFSTDYSGNLDWARTYGASGRDRGVGVKYNIDNGYTISAYTGSPYFGNTDGSMDPLFMKTDSLGWLACQMYSPNLTVENVVLAETDQGASNPYIIVANPITFTESSYTPNDTYVCQSCSTDPLFEPSDTLVCTGQQVEFLNTTQVGLTCFQEWSIEGQLINGGTNPEWVFTQQGVYEILLYSTCANTLDTIAMNINVIDPEINSPEPVCQFGSEVQLTANLPGGIWSGNGVTNPVQGIFSPSIADTGYILISYDVPELCLVTDSILVYPPPNVYGYPDTSVCEDEWVTVYGGGAESYTWSDGILDGFPFQGNTGTNTYTVTGIDTNGCVNNATVTVVVWPKPIADFTISQSELMFTFLNESLGAVSYSWNFGDGSAWEYNENAQHFYSEVDSQTYTIVLIAESEFGCLDTLSQLVQSPKPILFYVPNTFTPDNDEFNNTFVPVFYQGFDPYRFQMRIFDRWGELLFESNNAEIGWNGMYNHTYAQDGIYTWVIEFQSEEKNDRKRITGHVNLLR